MASAIADRLPTLGAEAKRTAVGVLGFAAAGYETLIAEQAGAGDERTSREALRALARIGSPKAAALIVAQLEDGPAQVQPVAEEALWRLPAAVVLAKARELLGRRRFVTRHPQVAVRLLERAAQSASAGLEPVLENLMPLRFHFWSPAVARVGARARTMERQASAQRGFRP
jgi:HEAT repeat protein